MGFYIVQFLTGLSSASALFLVASGLSIIFGVTRVVNFSHGSFYMVGAYLSWTLVEYMGGTTIGFWSAMALSAVGVGVLGAVMEMTVLRRVYKSPELFQLVATFGVILVIQDLALLVWGPEDRVGQRAPGLSGSVDIMGAAMPLYDLFLIGLSPVVLLLLWLLFSKTRWGILVRAATEDREIVASLGVNQTWLFTGTFFLGSMLAGLGGAAQLPKGGADLLMDFGILAEVFAVVVVGGMGSIPGAFLAAFLIAELSSFGVLIFPQSTLVTLFVVMAVVLMVRPWGLLGKPESLDEHADDGGLQLPLVPARGTEPWIWAGLCALLLSLPLYASEFFLSLVLEMGLMALFAASLHFVLGPGGLVSFGHAAFFGGGAYGAALLAEYFDSPMVVGLIAAPLAGGFLALVFGGFCVRLSGVYFAMLTMAFAQVLWSLVFQWGELTGGDDGIVGVWPADWADDTAIYYSLSMVLICLSVWAMRLVLHSPFGFTLRACRDSRRRAASIGIGVRYQQWLAFGVSGMFAGMAGGMYVYSKGSIFPDELAIARSFDALIMVMFGGVQSLLGPLLGGAFFTWLQDMISRFEYWRLALGALIILLVVLLPKGLVGVLELPNLWRRKGGRS